MSREKLRILCVDDEMQVLQGLKLNLRKHYDVTITESARKALEMLRQDSFAIVLSDMRMPEMSGADFLSKVSVGWPDTVRMLLTGYSEINIAIDAINKGGVFRFLTKPCPVEQLLKVLEDAAKQYRLIVAEKELLHKTLKGSVAVLVEILSIVDPEATMAFSNLRSVIVEIARRMGTSNTWDIEIAAMLSRIGAVTLPSELRVKERSAEPLEPAERQLLASIPEIGARLISHIPRLDSVSRIVRYQDKNFDGSGIPGDDVKGGDIPLGARILRVLKDIDTVEAARSPVELLNRLQSRKDLYDPNVLQQFIEVMELLPKGYELLDVSPEKLRIGDQLLTALVTENGKLLLAKGMRINQPFLEKLNHYIAIAGVRGPVKIERPT